MFLTRVAIIIIAGGYALGVQAKVPDFALSAVRSAYLAENRVLFYIGRHVHTDRVVIWGQTALSKDMIEILLEHPTDVQQMEVLLRGGDNRWRDRNYQNYRLYDFFVSEPGQTDKIFKDAVRGSQELQLLDGHVDRVEAGDDGLKFFSVRDREVLLARDTGKRVAKCAVSENGKACALLHDAFVSYEVRLTEVEQEILRYLEENIDALRGFGIRIAHMAAALGINSLTLGKSLTKLKQRVSKGHFVRDTKMLQLGGSRFYYRLTIGQLYVIEQRILDYFTDNMSAMEKDGIIVAEMAAELGLTALTLGAIKRSLKKRLDEDHFIHKIKWRTGRYHLDNDDIHAQTLAHFEENVDDLHNSGIKIADMVELLGINPSVLGIHVGYLKRSLGKDHFISRVRAVHGYYRLYDEEPHRSAKDMETEILTYLEANTSALQGDGILLSAMAADLDVSPKSLGWAMESFWKNLAADHPIQQIKRVIYRGQRHYQLFVGQHSFADQLILTYLQDNEDILRTSGISIATMAAALGKHPIALGRRIATLQQELDEDHLIQKVKLISGHYHYVD